MKVFLMSLLIATSVVSWAEAKPRAVKKPKATTSYVIPKPTTPETVQPPVAENGDVRGADNDGDGRTEPVYVQGYSKKNGTYVRGHYRAAPRRR